MEGKEDKDQPEPGSNPGGFQWQDWRQTLFWGIGTLLIAGSLFFLSPKGLSGFVASLAAFVRGWWTLSGIRLWQPLLALPAYEILPLVFAIAGVVRGLIKKETDTLRLAVWALVALVLALIYPGKQTGDIVWALLPLWVLAACEMACHFDFHRANRWEVAGVIVVVMAFVIFGWLNLATVTTMDWSSALVRTRLWLVAAVVLLIAMSLLLVGAGWSVTVARLGGVWSSIIALTLFTVAMSTGAGGLREPRTIELWQPVPRTGPADEIVKVANQISEQNRGTAAQLPLTILNVNSPALRWLFRDWQVQEVGALPQDARPELIISSSQDISLAADYHGEPLTLHETVAWDKATTADWLKWFIYRQMPLQRGKVILWVRSDLMLDSQNTSSSQ